jgi:hypothetical protein
MAVVSTKDKEQRLDGFSGKALPALDLASTEAGVGIGWCWRRAYSALHSVSVIGAGPLVRAAVPRSALRSREPSASHGSRSYAAGRRSRLCGRLPKGSPLLPKLPHGLI